MKLEKQAVKICLGTLFGDDVSASLQQRTYFDLIDGSDINEGETEEPNGGISSLAPTEEASPATLPPVPPTPEQHALQPIQEIPVPDDEDLGSASPVGSQAEPEQEEVPPSRRESDIIPPSPTEDSASLASPVPMPLQQAMHRSLDALDGIRPASRQRSRPPRTRNRVKQPGPRSLTMRRLPGSRRKA